MDVGLLIKQIFNAGALISTVTLVALGLYVVFGIMRVINMAHGEFLMLGAYFTFFLSGTGLNFWLALILATVLVAVTGLGFERLALRRLYVRLYRQNDYLSPLLATWGLSLVLQRCVAIFAGANSRFIPVPVRGYVVIWGSTYPYYNLFITAIALAVIVGVVVFIQKSNFGVLVRATMDDTDTAAAMGINTNHIYMLTFALGTGLAGFAGGLIAPLVQVNPTMGTDYIVRSFLIVVIVGSGTILGALGAGGIVGGIESTFASVSSTTIGQIVVLLATMAIVVARPRGLFTGREEFRR